jgi:serine/threonine protein kinase
MRIGAAPFQRNGPEMREPLKPNDPETIGRFHLTARLGQGGMGTVFLGEADGEPPVAIKLINSEYAAVPEFRERFRREVNAARRVRSHSTAPVVEASLDDDPLYVAVEFIDGPDLETVVARKGPLRGSSLEQLAVGVATALRAIHEGGLIHRDLKPSNVLLSPTGPRVIDFGISRAMDGMTQLTKPGQIIGTPAYIAPELIDGRPLTPAADVFSWGGVVAFAGTGRVPFDGRSVHEVLNKVGFHSPDLDGLEPLLRDVVERALSKRPEERPTVARLLDEFSAGLDASRPAPPAKPPAASSTNPPTRVFESDPHPPPTPTPTPPPWDTTGGLGRVQTRPPRPRSRVPGLRTFSMLVFGIVPVLLVAWGLSRSPALFEDIERKFQEARGERTPSRTPSAGAGVGKFFVGEWRGTVKEGTSKYTLILKIRQGREGQKVGTTRYVQLDCSGELRLVKATSTKLRLQERITDNSEHLCVSGPIVLTRKSSALDYLWDDSSGDDARGRLTRQD